MSVVGVGAQVWCRGVLSHDACDVSIPLPVDRKTPVQPHILSKILRPKHLCFIFYFCRLSGLTVESSTSWRESSTRWFTTCLKRSGTCWNRWSDKPRDLSVFTLIETNTNSKAISLSAFCSVQYELDWYTWKVSGWFSSRLFFKVCLQVTSPSQVNAKV